MTERERIVLSAYEQANVVPRQAQRQDSLTDQMVTVYAAANRLGCYDAADAIRERFLSSSGGSSV